MTRVMRFTTSIEEKSIGTMKSLKSRIFITPTVTEMKHRTMSR